MDDDALIIELEILNFASVAGQLLAISRLVANIKTPLSGANQLVLQHSRNVQAASGPWSRLLQAQQRYAQALASGNQMQIFDAYNNLQQKGKAYNSANNSMTPGGDFMQKMKNLIFSTRFGYGSGGGLGGLHPLIGRTVQALGAAGPLGLAVGAAAMGITLMAKAAEAASHILNDFSSARYTGGGTLKETSMAAHIGAALGLDAGALAGMARGMAGKLDSDGLARMYGAQMGLKQPMMGTPNAQVDVFKNLFSAAKQIANMKDQDEAIRRARALGIEEVLSLRDLSEAARKNVFDSTDAMFGQDQIQAAAEFRKASGDLNLQFQKLLVTMTPFIKILADFTGWLANTMGGATKGFMNHGFGNIAPPKSLDKHTDATEKNTGALYALKNGLDRALYGGGDRARGAMPSGMQGLAWQKAMESDALKLGAFAL